MNRRQAIALTFLAMLRGTRVPAQQMDIQPTKPENAGQLKASTAWPPGPSEDQLVELSQPPSWFQIMFDGCAGVRFLKRERHWDGKRETFTEETIEVPTDELWKALKGDEYP